MYSVIAFNLNSGYLETVFLLFLLSNIFSLFFLDKLKENN